MSDESKDRHTRPGNGMLEEISRTPEDLRFPFLSNRFSGSRHPSKTQWLLKYFTYRTADPFPTEERCKAFYESIGVDAADDINRFRGALLGCALGDALGTTVEFQPPGTFEPVTDIVGGGPFGLKAGEWTDDTSMMYCLAHSLLRKRGFDLHDQIELYRLWWQDGVFSVNGRCFDIGNTVLDALHRYVDTGLVKAGSDDSMSAGNGSLMRLAPVPMYCYDSFEEAVHLGGESSLTTHGAVEAVDACRYFSGLLWGALHGEPKQKLLEGLYSPIEGFWDRNPLCPSVRRIVEQADYKWKAAGDIRGSGYVLHSLEAALWAFHGTDDFISGVLKAVNLGEDADTTGAIFGQLAGAYYGERTLPTAWLKKLAWVNVFYLKAEELKELVHHRRG